MKSAPSSPTSTGAWLSTIWMTILWFRATISRKQEVSLPSKSPNACTNRHPKRRRNSSGSASKRIGAIWTRNSHFSRIWRGGRVRRVSDLAASPVRPARWSSTRTRSGWKSSRRRCKKRNRRALSRKRAVNRQSGTKKATRSFKNGKNASWWPSLTLWIAIWTTRLALRRLISRQSRRM